MVSTYKRIRKDSPARALLAFVLKNDPGSKRCYKNLMRMGAVNIRPDYILFRLPSGNCGRADDPGAWNARLPIRGNLNNGITLCMIRHGENDWSIHS
jgi:hypothetical protein